MLRTFIAAFLLIAVGVVGMAVTIILKKDGRFPDGEISHNRELRRRGVICAKEQELGMWGRRGRRNLSRKTDSDKPAVCPEGGCEGCSFFGQQKDDEDK